MGTNKPLHFALTGLAGYIAPRHLQAIKDTGNCLVAALDPQDSVGIIDSYFPDCAYFREFERFDRHIEKLRRSSSPCAIDYVSICSPNFLHDAHIRFALRVGAHAICEKPLVIRPWNLDALEELERESGRRVYTVLQLRLHPAIRALRAQVQAAPERHYKVSLDYITSRGQWYLYSWKGDPQKSGGLATNIGVHFFDMLMWIFGRLRSSEVREYGLRNCAGTLELDRATVEWNLSIDANRLPAATREAGQRTYRSLRIDGKEFEFSEGFTALHTEVYKEILAGRGFGITDARAAVELTHQLSQYYRPEAQAHS